MKTALRRVLKIVVGWVLILVGVIGALLPIIPGFVFFFLGLALLSGESVWLRRKLEAVKERFPRQMGKVQSLKESWSARLKKYM